MAEAARPAPGLSAAGFSRPGRYATECRLMFVLIGPGHSTDAVTGLLRPWRSRPRVGISATEPCFTRLYAPRKPPANNPAIDAVELMWPSPCLSMIGKKTSTP